MEQERTQPLLVAARLCAALALAVWALASLAFVGRDAEGLVLLEDAQRGRVTSVVATYDGVLWRTDGVRRPWHTDLPLRVAGQSYGRFQVSDLLEEYAPGERIPVTQRSSLEPRWLRLTAVAAGVFSFLLLIGGADPWRANRWGWFWLLGLGRDVGLGALLFLLLSGPTPGIPRPRPDAERWTGWRALAVAMIVGIALQFGWYAVRGLVWPAHPGGPIVLKEPR
jgi:hypothetical protein